MASEIGQTLFMDEPGSIEIHEHEVPEPEPGAVVGEVIQSNVCGSDVHIFCGHHPLVKQGPLGHEAVCRVGALGEGVETDYAGNSVSVGDRVAPVYFQTCQRCRYCRMGELHLCEHKYDHMTNSPEEPPHFHGTFGTHYYIRPTQYFYKVPDSVQSETAAAANCALSQVMYGLDQVDAGNNDTVVVQGAGGLGLNSIAVLNELGAETIVIEGVDRRIDRAREFGADHVIDFQEYETVEDRANRVQELTDGLGADIAVEVAGVPEAFSEGPSLLRDGAKYLEIGNITIGQTAEFDPARLTRAAIEVRAVTRYQPWYLYKALSFLEKHADDYPYDELIDTTYRLGEAAEAIEQSENRTNIRAALQP